LTNQKGFTLIEMLVVLIIIGILVSVGAPNIMRARDNAEVAALQIEMSGFQLDLEQYYLENDYNYPDGIDEARRFKDGYNHLSEHLLKNNTDDIDYEFTEDKYHFRIENLTDGLENEFSLEINSEKPGVHRKLQSDTDEPI